MKILLFLIALLSFSCTHSIHNVHVGDFDPYETYAAGKYIKSYAEQLSIMGFRFNTDYVNDARQKLLDQCPAGTIQGTITRFSTSHNFFHWTNKISMEGLCITH